MGLPAERASSRTAPQVGDLVIKGNILSINEGSAAERVAIGFGSGAAQLKAAAAGYLMTISGLRKLGSGTADTSGSKSPGAAAGRCRCHCDRQPCGTHHQHWDESIWGGERQQHNRRQGQGYGQRNRRSYYR